MLVVPTRQITVLFFFEQRIQVTQPRSRTRKDKREITSGLARCASAPDSAREKEEQTSTQQLNKLSLTSSPGHFQILRLGWRSRRTDIVQPQQRADSIRNSSSWSNRHSFLHAAFPCPQPSASNVAFDLPSATGNYALGFF